MKVLHTIRDFGVKSGGTSTSTYDLLSAIHKVDNQSMIDLITPDVTDPKDKVIGAGEQWIKVVPCDYRTPLALSRNLATYLSNSEYDIYHTNGLWLHVNHKTCAIARKKGKPYVITPHGMLYPETLKRSAWKKQIMRKIWFDNDIFNADIIHVTCETEMTHVRNLGYKGPIALIGNPVFIPDYSAKLFSIKINAIRQGNWSVAFLGRLHPRKKVENILYGVAKTARHDIKIYIIGKGDDNYEDFLRNETRRLGIEHQVNFLGFLNGIDKYAQLGKVDCLFVPSDMENFGMIIPEAMIVGTPVMASLGTPWKVLNDLNCGWWTDNSPESIAKVILKLTSLNEKEYIAMGQRGREYILNTFAAESVAKDMLRMYKWLNGEADRPDFIYC